MSNISMKCHQYIYIYFLLFIIFLFNAFSAFGAMTTSMAVADGKIFLGELGGTIRVFDMEKRAVVSRVFLPNTHTIELFNDNGRILAKTSSTSSTLYEITHEGDAEKIGDVPSGLVGLDNDYYYYAYYLFTQGRFETFRLNKNSLNRIEGHFPDFPDLAVHLQTEDAHNYWYFCSVLTDQPQRGRTGFALVKKTKKSGKVVQFRSPKAMSWIEVELANDRDSVWIILTGYDVYKSCMINFNKTDNTFAVVNYSGAEQLIPNLDMAKMPSYTYVAHQSHQVFAVSSDAVRQGKEIPAEFLLIQNLYRFIPNPDGIWSPNETYEKPGMQSKRMVPSIKRVLSNYAYIRYHASFTYGENLWFVAERVIEGELVYDVVTVPLVEGDFEIYPITSKAGNIKKVTVKAGAKKNTQEQITALSEEKSENAFNQLLELFQQPGNERYVGPIINSLAKINKDKAIKTLIELYKTTKDAEIESRSAYALGILEDKSAVTILYETFSNPGSKNKYIAAYALGYLKDPRVVPFLRLLLNSNFVTQSRAISALSHYKDPQDCQQFYKIWMQGTDPLVQFAAGSAVLYAECDCHLLRNTEYKISDKSCSNLQKLVDTVAKSIATSDEKNEWKKSASASVVIKSYIKQYTSDNSSEATTIANLVMRIMDWAESVDNFHDLKDMGSLDDNRNQYDYEIVKYRRKEEGILHYCPSLKFPSFSYWNEVIKKVSEREHR